MKRNRINKRLILFLFSLLLVSCDTEHRGQAIKEYSGDYRYQNGIAEFFDCHDRRKYYVAKSGKHKKVQDEYVALKLKDNDDAYVKVKGYVKPEVLMDNISTVNVFVVTQFLTIDHTRSCTESRRAGF